MPQAKKKAATKKPAAKKRAATKSAPKTEPPSSPVEQTVPVQSLNPYQPKHRALTKVDQNAVHEQRQAELAAEREAHNRRTGDISR